MRTTWRIRLTWMLAIVYGLVSAAGEGLHLLPGQCHDACCRGDACTDEDCQCDGCDDCQPHDCCLAFAQPRDATGSAQLAAPMPVAHDHEHCAICQFLAQGTWFLLPMSVPRWQFFCGYERPAKAIFVACRPEHLPFLSRAPPAPVDC